jgi:hypothetical protein
LAGALLALAVLFWLPYVFVLPAAMAAPLLLNEPDRERFRFMGITVAVCAVVGLVAYASATMAVGVRSPVDLKAWILAAGHGQIQPGGLRVPARLAFSIPRSFVNMGHDGMLLKRYLVHDPYAPVTAADLLRLSLWKVLLFYAAAVVVVQLLRSERGHKLLALLVLAVVPIVLFSIFVFEAGSIERYLPLYPFFFIALGYAWANRQGAFYGRATLGVFLIAVIVVNFAAMWRGTLEQQRADAVIRIRELVPLLDSRTLVLAVNEQDSLAVYCHDFPLDQINLKQELQYYDLLEINAARLATWRQDFAKRVLWTWRQGGTVWVPLRVLRDRPNPEWNWVEGDDPRVHWSDLPGFFSRLTLGTQVGGSDGFVSLPDDPVNRDLLTPLAMRGQRRN